MLESNCNDISKIVEKIFNNFEEIINENYDNI